MKLNSNSKIIIAFVIGIVLMFVTFGIIQHYDNLRIEEKNKKIEDKKLKEKAIKDSSNVHFNYGEYLYKENIIDSAITELDSALSLNKDNSDAIFLKGKILFNKKEYSEAISVLNKIEDREFYRGDSRLIIGKCYLKLKNKEEACKNFHKATIYGNKEAERLQNKHNPIKKVFSHYIVRCCDGSTSSHSGRGACSHHGGVCNSKEPVYIKKRKYTFR